MTATGDCSFEGCKKTGRLTRGLCGTHYAQKRRAGEYGGEICTVDDCNKIIMGRGKCPTHYAEDRRSGLHDVAKCEVSDCSKVAMSRGVCSTHAWRRDNGKEMEGEVRGAGPWRDWEITGKGYVRRRRSTPEGKREWQWEHRIIMEEILGRPLLSHEEIHHRNGNRADNRPGNLQLWSTKQPKGQHWVDKLTYAREIISLYGPLEESGFDDGESGS